MKDVMDIHMCVDVPLGLFLSGGVDSSLLAAQLANAWTNLCTRSRWASPALRCTTRSMTRCGTARRRAVPHPPQCVRGQYRRHAGLSAAQRMGG
ncbi:asparagine synthase-related protein [Thiobacillus denitrificans]|uniref:asparagine synthase-related protein n=1 Tax=Thiobacillus denitrificans TaxID=36861 RepID=UPI002350B7CE|nr:asparagine synthase-related protein [Thiobacillus denitrificans]